MSVSADFTLLGLTFNVQDVTIDYTASPESLSLFGSVTVSTGGSNPTLDGLTASFGTKDNPGLVLAESNGHLKVQSTTSASVADSTCSASTSSPRSSTCSTTRQTTPSVSPAA